MVTKIEEEKIVRRYTAYVYNDTYTFCLFVCMFIRFKLLYNPENFKYESRSSIQVFLIWMKFIIYSTSLKSNIRIHSCIWKIISEASVCYTKRRPLSK